MSTDGAARVGIVGAGGISSLHLDGMARHADVAVPVAICDPNEESAAARAKEYGIPHSYGSLDGLLASAELDAAIVCTPTHVRVDVVEPLLRAGVPVLCEKPLAETYEEAVAIESMSQKYGVPVAVNQNFRRHYAFDMARTALADDGLGKALHVSHVANGLRRDVGWRVGRRRYAMAVMSIHWFDGYRYMLADEGESVYCRAVNSPATEGGDDTAVAVVIQFRKGAVVSLSESFSSFTSGRVCTVDCERGGLILDYEKLVSVDTDMNRTETSNAYDKPEATYAVLADLLASRREGRDPETSATDNLKSMAILEAAYRSAESGRAVRVEEVCSE